MTTAQIIETSAYFLALVNPVSKVFILSTTLRSRAEVWRVSLRSTVVAFVLLALMACAGRLLFTSVFHVNIYSLKVAGGIVLFMVGLHAVRQGRFYDTTDEAATADISIVPLAAPLIAGPGTITGVISYASVHGELVTILCLSLALGANLVCMLLSLQIGRFLERINATGPLIRITGLIVSAVAVQMVLTGLGEWNWGRS